MVYVKPFVQVRQETSVSFCCQRHSSSLSIPCSNSFTGKHSSGTVFRCPAHHLIPACCRLLIWRGPGDTPASQVSSGLYKLCSYISIAWRSPRREKGWPPHPNHDWDRVRDLAHLTWQHSASSCRLRCFSVCPFFIENGKNWLTYHIEKASHCVEGDSCSQGHALVADHEPGGGGAEVWSADKVQELGLSSKSRWRKEYIPDQPRTLLAGQIYIWKRWHL